MSEKLPEDPAVVAWIGDIYQAEKRVGNYTLAY